VYVVENTRPDITLHLEILLGGQVDL